MQLVSGTQYEIRLKKVCAQSFASRRRKKNILIMLSSENLLPSVLILLILCLRWGLRVAFQWAGIALFSEGRSLTKSSLASPSLSSQYITWTPGVSPRSMDLAPNQIGQNLSIGSGAILSQIRITGSSLVTSISIDPSRTATSREETYLIP